MPGPEGRGKEGRKKRKVLSVSMREKGKDEGNYDDDDLEQIS